VTWRGNRPNRVRLAGVGKGKTYGGALRYNGGPIAFAQILNTGVTTDAARDASLRLQTRMESINKNLQKLHPDLFRLKRRLDIVAALLFKEPRVVEYGSVTCTVTGVVNQSNVGNTCRNYCPILTL
jgi:hypothetical protein